MYCWANPEQGNQACSKKKPKIPRTAFTFPPATSLHLDRDEWRDKTLFIDGLDEARAGKDDARTPLDAIRGKLNKLDCKCFRISCREADWLGSPDAKDLEQNQP